MQTKKKKGKLKEKKMKNQNNKKNIYLQKKENKERKDNKENNLKKKKCITRTLYTCTHSHTLHLCSINIPNTRSSSLGGERRARGAAQKISSL